MDATAVGAFVVLDLLLVLTPGPDWAYAISAGLRDRALPAVGGLAAGYATHTALAVAGLAVLVAGTPGLLPTLTLVGAAYLVWLGAGTLARPPTAWARPAGLPPSAAQAALRGAGVSGLNPKGLLLFLAVLPQFLDPAAAWPVPLQTGLLGGLHVTTCFVIMLIVAVSARTVLQSRPGAAHAVTLASGALLLGSGVLLLGDALVG